MTARLLGLLVAGAMVPAAAQAQSSLTTEVDLTVGRSSEGITIAAAQARLFGSTSSDWRFFLEGAANAVTASESDAFGAAYPYSHRARPMEAYVEKISRPGGLLLGVRGGRYRTPFGISGRSDHAYIGFVRAPLIRYTDNWALSTAYFEAGGEVMAGTPSLSVQASLGVPSDEGNERRCRALDVVVRGQAYYRSFIVGVSSMRSRPSDPRHLDDGNLVFHGVDVRWMRGGVQLRGEWIAGRPFDDVATQGGYVDAIVHPIWMGPVTAVARAERLDYDAGKRSEYLRRYTAGARIRVTSALAAQVNVIKQPESLDAPGFRALDFTLTYSVRF
jgi:hypothetical protein